MLNREFERTFIFLQVNGVSVATFSHQEVVEAIKDSGDMLSLKVVTLPPDEDQQSERQNGNVGQFKNGKLPPSSSNLLI